MSDSRGKTRTAIYKRNKKKLKTYLKLYPKDTLFSFLPQGYLEERTSLPSTSSSSSSSVPPSSILENTSNQIISRRSLDQSLQPHMEENLEDRIHPVHVEESNENNENTGSEIEDYFSDSSEEFSDAERIENSTYENEVESNRHHEDNSNIDSSDSDFEDTSGLNNPFFSVNTPTFSFPFISKPNLTENDHLLAILAISARNNFSFEAMLSIFTWMKITHTNNNLPTTKKALWKVLHRDDTLIKRHLYCGVCKEHIGVGKKPSKTCTCESCGPDKKSVDARYFLQLSLKSQLNEFFKIPNIDKSLQYRFTREKRDLSAIEDIFDGRFYQNLSLPGNFLDNPLNFSFAMNTDGCQVAKSSKASAWPVYLQFNELPPHLRKKHMLLAGIFVDVSHPSLNLVLDPMIKELRELYTTGILWRTSDGREVRSKFVVTTCIVDSPARSLILRMKQFNGYYGCTFCYAKGEHQKHKHVYPRTDWSTNLRTDEEMRRDMLAAYETKTIINGIKGISALSGLPEFDLANGLAVDSLHAVFLGAVKQHTNLFFTATDSPYYVGDPTSKAMIDKRLLSIKPPSRRARLPRSVETFNNWKGSELRNWLDYASPCLDGILHSKYIKHLALLAQAVHYLNSDSITAANLEKAAHLLEKYISQFEELFGLENMSYNLHLFAHLIITIKNLGPMWVNNASTYESWNKKIMDKVTSPHERAVQVVMQFLMTKFVESAIYSDSISTETKKFICNILKIPNLSEEIVINKDFQVVSSPEIVRFQEVELTVLQEAGYASVNNPFSYAKIKINGTEYQSQNNNDTKYCNSVVSFGNQFGEILSIIDFHNEANTKVQGFFIKLYKIKKCAYETTYIKEVEISNDITFIKELKSIRPATKICTDIGVFVFALPNCWETD